MLNSLVLLIYHAIYGLKGRNEFYCISELKQHLVNIWQSAAEHY